MTTPAMELRKVTKRFGSVIALRDVGIAVQAGEVHCLLGDNGAGKSTLIKILSGVHRPTKGEILVDGKPVTFRSPRDAQEQGIATVFQDLGMIPLMSISRNFFLGREPLRGVVHLRALRQGERQRHRPQGDGAISASTCATRPRRSARCPAASASRWRSRAPSISAPRC